MLKIYYTCTNCYANGEVDDNNFDGCCPHCHEHHGEILYYYKGNVEDFLLDISNMSEVELARNCDRIKIAAESLLEN